MKTLLFLLFPIALFSQKGFKKLDSADFMKQVDAIIKTTGKDYILEKEGKEDGINYFIYTLKQSPDDRFVLIYNIMLEGENKNLEIPGTRKWNFRSIKGTYLTLFPVWKNFIDPAADKEKLASSGHKSKGDFSMHEIEAPLWWIRF